MGEEGNGLVREAKGVGDGDGDDDERQREAKGEVGILLLHRREMEDS